MLLAVQAVFTTVSGTTGWISSSDWTPPQIQGVLQNDSELRQLCVDLQHRHRLDVFGSDAPVGWGSINPEFRAHCDAFVVKPSQIIGAGHGLFATKVVKRGTVLLYGGVECKFDDNVKHFAIEWRMCKANLHLKVVGSPFLCGGYRACMANEPRRAENGLAWKDLSGVERANCMFNESKDGVYLVVCEDLGRPSVPTCVLSNSL